MSNITHDEYYVYDFLETNTLIFNGPIQIKNHS